MSKEKEVKVDEPILEEEVKAEPKKAEPKKVDVQAFISRKLKLINEMPNKAKAKVLAERVLRNK